MEPYRWVKVGWWQRIRWTTPRFLASALLVAMAAISCTRTGSGPAEMTAAEKIARGKELSYSAGCNDCHTPGTFYGAPDTTRLLSGSELGWEGPWGVTYPRNLTPDPETGIGSWTEEQIVTAVRTGVRPDGSPILPPMPWPGFAHMSDADVQALAAFLKSIPHISHQVPDRVPPGSPATGARLIVPPPPAWDAQTLPPPPGAPADTATGS